MEIKKIKDDKDSKNIELTKNECYDVVIDGMTSEGLGVARIEGFPVFIPNSLIGEKIKTLIILVKKSYAVGKVLEFYEKSQDRVEPICKIYSQCGGCQFQHIKYDSQLDVKRDLVVNQLKKIGRLKDVNVLPTIGMENPYNYRNKTQVPFSLDKNQKVVAGFYKKHSHSIIDMENCLIQTQEADDIIATMKELCEQFNIVPYDERNHSGILRHVVVRKAFNTGEIMVILVTRKPNVPILDKVADVLKERFPEIKSIVQNINQDKTNVIFGKSNKLIYGQEYIYDVMNKIKFAISPRSFYQVNTMQTEKLYSKAVEFADLKGDEIVFDAYCGIGTISLFLAKKAKVVYGIEIVHDAINDAKINSELNDIKNVEFIVGKAERVIPDLINGKSVDGVNLKEEKIIPDVIVVDPPRKGCDKALLESILEAAPKRLIYVSCDPATLARDLRILVDGGYNIIKIQPVDMFPQTCHVETVVLMSRVDK